MYAVFSISGRQFKVEPGQTLHVDFMGETKEGEKVKFEKVLIVSDGQKVRIGAPYVGAVVNATVVTHGRDRKVIVYKKKRRVDYHKKQGHRQHYTTVQIDSITG
jgi:large subunit ribosomal protein L21